MKKVLPFILMVLLGLPMFAADDLYVRLDDGDTKISISSIKEITFPSGSVEVSLTDGTTKSFSSSTFVSLRFNGNAASVVENLLNGDDVIVFDGLMVKSPQAGIVIYSADGRLVQTSDGECVDVSALAEGIYIVKSGCLTSKIVK